MTTPLQTILTTSINLALGLRNATCFHEIQDAILLVLPDDQRRKLQRKFDAVLEANTIVAFLKELALFMATAFCFYSSDPNEVDWIILYADIVNASLIAEPNLAVFLAYLTDFIDNYNSRLKGDEVLVSAGNLTALTGEALQKALTEWKYIYLKNITTPNITFGYSEALRSQSSNIQALTGAELLVALGVYQVTLTEALSCKAPC